jgi:hypothetical protein
MTEGFKLALPVECASARFQDNRAAIDLGNDREKLIAHDAALQHNAPSVVDPVQLEHVLGNVDAECLDSHEALLLLRLSACRTGGRAVHPISWRNEYGGLKKRQGDDGVGFHIVG